MGRKADRDHLILAALALAGEDDAALGIHVLERRHAHLVRRSPVE
jgi:hypothetical protein